MSPGHSTRHEELLPAFALGALDGEDLRELETHLAAGCEECRRQLDLWQGDVEELAASVEPVQPSEATRKRIQRLAGAPAPVRRSPVTRWLQLAAAACLLIAAGSLWRQAQLTRQLDRLGAERDHLAREVAGLDKQLGLARAESQRLAESLSIIASPGSRSIQLAGLGPTPQASGHTFVSPERGEAVFYAFHLPAPEPGKTYQLWWIQDGKPVSAGTFGVDERGSGSLRVQNVAPAGQIQAWAVTVEPEGGVPQPTGAMVLKG
ncbi:MAG TPA: anti-sigma factor [Thermoanaerobaculia bacterium]|jgi:anti-sigma-K factor RskA|nr:anti-sigma factor [Thermoanaerobaculia bacterium]